MNFEKETAVRENEASVSCIGVTYGVVEEKYSIGESTRISYGISAYSDCDGDGEATVIASVHDVTPSREKAQEIAEKCNRAELSALHLQDVIEDFLSE